MVIDESNIRKSVVKLVLPSVAEQALMMVVGVISTAFVGQISKQAVSAVGLINTLIGFIMVLYVALTTGCTVLVARLVGENELDKARETVRQCIVLGTSISILVSMVCYALSPQLITMFFGSAEADVLHMAELYFKIVLYTFPLTLINIIISGSMRGAGDTKTPMIIAWIVNIFNLLLNIMLLKIFHFGIIGAAYAVSISRGIGGVLSIVILFWSQSLIKFNIFDRFHINKDLIARVLKVGLPAAMEQVVMQGGFLVLQIVIAGMGTAAIAVYQIGMSINSMCYIPIWGFGIAATTMIGQSLGARKPSLAEKCGWDTLKMGLFVTFILTTFIFIFAGKLVALYSHDAEVIRIGAKAIRIFCISQPFLSMVVVFSGALRGAGDIFYVMITSFVGIWGFRVLFTIMLDRLFGFGIMGVWIALCMDFFIRAAMYYVRFRKGKWKQIVV